jgi:hypothetical protein
MSEDITCTPKLPVGSYPCDGDGCPLPSVEYIAVVQSKWWGANGVNLAVAFTEPIQESLKNRIMDLANSWGEFANVRFRHTTQLGAAPVRITRQLEGYWSYLGRDLLDIPIRQPTMCLQQMMWDNPRIAEVVKHEFGHALGCPHEHQRAEIVQRIDPAKAIRLGRERFGWSEQMVRSQMLTPLSEASLMGSRPDESSIMAYVLSGEWTYDGQPIVGGTDFSDSDRSFFASLYPKPGEPVKPKPTNGGKTIMGIIPWIRGALQIAQQAAKLTRTTADDLIIAGLIELLDLYVDSQVTDKRAAANIIIARMF